MNTIIHTATPLTNFVVQETMDWSPQDTDLNIIEITVMKPQSRTNMTEIQTLLQCFVLFLFSQHPQLNLNVFVADYQKSSKLQEFISNLNVVFNQSTLTSEDTQLLCLLKYHEARTITVLAN